MTPVPVGEVGLVGLGHVSHPQNFSLSMVKRTKQDISMRLVGSEDLSVGFGAPGEVFQRCRWGMIRVFCIGMIFGVVMLVSLDYSVFLHFPMIQF